MGLLYADLPRQGGGPGPDDPPERHRVELLVGGVVAAAGVALVGTGVVGDLLRRTRDGAEQTTWGGVSSAGTGGGPAPDPSSVAGSVAFGIGSGGIPGPAGDEGAVVPARPELAPAVENEYPASPLTGDGASGARAGSLPGPGVAARPVRPVTDPSPPAPAAPPAAEPEVPDPPPTSTVASTTTAPPSSTTVPPTTTTAPPSSTTAPPERREGPSRPDPTLVLAASGGFNATSAMRQVIDEFGVEGWIDAQLRPESVADPAVDAALAGFDLLDRDPEELRANGRAAVALAQIRWADVVRRYVGERQIHGAVVGAWRDFFSVDGDAADLVAHEQALQHLALGRFEDLLVAISEGPALRRRVGYRADARGRGGGAVPTELARILVERFTVGPGVATADEIEAAALAIGGWSFGAADDAGSGRAARLALIADLVRRPETARRVALVLCERLLGDGSSPETVAAVARAYLDNDTTIAPAVRVALRSLGPGAGVTPRRGSEWVISALRALNAEIDISGEWNPTRGDTLPGHLHRVGEEPSAVSLRWAVARRLTGADGSGGVRVDLGWFRPTVAQAPTAGAAVAVVAERLGVGRMSTEETSALLAYIGRDADQPFDGEIEPGTLADLAALVISFPTFMRRDGSRLA